MSISASSTDKTAAFLVALVVALICVGWWGFLLLGIGALIIFAVLSSGA